MSATANTGMDYQLDMGDEYNLENITLGNLNDFMAGYRQWGGGKMRFGRMSLWEILSIDYCDFSLSWSLCYVLYLF